MKVKSSFVSPGARGRAFGASLLLAGAMTATPVLSSTPRVALGEVSTRVVRPDVDLGEVLRASVAEQLVTFEAPHADRERVILSLALVRMESDGAWVTCVVSATLRTARGGTILAMLEGRARLESSSPLSPGLARRAVEAAAHATMVRIPDALR
jgi:hypothetical protein